VTALYLAALQGHSQIIRLVMNELSISRRLGNEAREGYKQAQGIVDTVDLLQYLVSGYPTDLYFHQSLGNEFMRQRKYADAKFRMTYRLVFVCRRSKQPE
jgi:hypothetical protein